MKKLYTLLLVCAISSSYAQIRLETSNPCFHSIIELKTTTTILPALDSINYPISLSNINNMICQDTYTTRYSISSVYTVTKHIK